MFNGVQKENPSIGLYKFYLSKNKRSFTKSYTVAQFFKFVRPSGSKSRWFKIPEKYVGVRKRKRYVKAFVAAYHDIEESKRAESRRRYAARRKNEGKRYATRAAKTPTHKAVSISKRELEEIEREFGDQIREVKEKVLKAPTEIKQIVSEDVFQRRYEELVGTVLSDLKEQKGKQATKFMLHTRFSPTSKGKATPFLKGQPSNWREIQIKGGIKEEESIVWTITRFVRQEGIKFFKSVGNSFTKSKLFDYRISMVTNLEEHDHLMISQGEDGLPLKITVNLGESKKFLWSKKHISKIEWQFVQAFMKTIYRGDGEMFRSGQLTSSGTTFQQDISTRAKKALHNFKIGFVISLTGVHK